MAFSIYMDENIPFELVIWLRNRGVDVLRCQDAGTLGDPDDSHLVRSTQLEHVLLTRDNDFVKMSAEWTRQGRVHAGIVYLQSDKRDNPSYVVNRIMGWHQRFDKSQMTNVVWWV